MEKSFKQVNKAVVKKDAMNLLLVELKLFIHIKMFLINVLQWLVKHIQNLVHMIV